MLDLPPLGEDYEEVGSMFESFYRALEGALSSSKDPTTEVDDEDYESRDESISEKSEEEEEEEEDEEEEESDEESDNSDYTDDKKRKKRDLESKSRKSLTTKITVTSEYDDSKAELQKIDGTNKTTVKTKKKRVESEESEEEMNLLDELMENFNYSEENYSDEVVKAQKGVKDQSSVENLPRPSKIYQEDYEEPGNNQEDYEEPENILNNHDDYEETYDFKSNQPPSYDDSSEFLENTSEEPEDSNFITRVFSSITSFFSSLFNGFSEPSTAKVDLKRPKRENGEQFSWFDDDLTTIPPFSNDEVLTTTSRAMPYDFFGMFSNLMPTGRRESPFNLNPSPMMRKKYTNYQLWRIFPTSSDDLSHLDDFRMSEEGSKVHWLKPPSLHGSSDVIIPPEYLENFKEFLKDGGIKFSVKLRNIQHAIRFENLRLNRRQQIETEILNGHPLTFYHFHPSKDIFAYYGHIKRTYPNFVELIPLGFSYNSKPLTIVKIATSKNLRKPGIFILSGTSPHMWLSIASSLHILNNLVTNAASNDSFGAMIRKYDWYVLSLLNVDGYDHTMTYDRLWMKTRSQHLNENDGIFSTA